MPITLNDREQAFEAQFAHNEEFRFLVAARRDKLFARWAAAKIRLCAPAPATAERNEAERNEAERNEAERNEAERNEAELIRAVLAIGPGPGHDRAVVARVAEAFPSPTTRPSAADLSAALELCERQAREQRLEAPHQHPA